MNRIGWSREHYAAFMDEMEEGPARDFYQRVKDDVAPAPTEQPKPEQPPAPQGKEKPTHPRHGKNF